MTLTTEARFGGLWSLTREITDHGGGPNGRFRGLARIFPDGEGLRYEEHGRLTLGASKTQATRVWLWRLEGPTGVAVLFEDGRPFHRFDWGAAESRDEHLCPPDRYAVRYGFSAESWRTHWTVSGPFKNYEMRALYLRPTRSAE